MTFFLPSLHHLKSSDPGIGSRFSIMANIILEGYGHHSVVISEAMAFFEVLAAHEDIVPPLSSKLLYTENPILSCIPFLIKNMSPNQPEVQPNGRWHGPSGCRSSKIGLRATLRTIKILSATKILIAAWSDMELVSVLFAALESLCGSRCFSGETFHRSLAAPREAELVYSGGDATERELTEVIRLLLYLEHAVSKGSTTLLLRWILLSRILLSGAGSTCPEDEDVDDDDESFTVSRVIRSASTQALSDVSPILDVANPVRWQVKSIAAQMATIAIVEMARASRGDNGLAFVELPHFNPKVAHSVCSKECTDAASISSVLPASRLAFHLSDVITATCATSTATVDQAELQILQESGLHLLAEVIMCFGRIPDPEQPDSNILSEFIPQITSCIKYALGAAVDGEGEMPSRLFMAGCEVLRAFVLVELTDDNMVLKRVARGVLLSPEEVPFFEHGVGLPIDFFEVDEDKKNSNLRAFLLMRIGKLWSLGILPSFILKEMKASESEVGVHATALAIDGACLLLGSGLSLCGNSTDNKADPQIESGFFYQDIIDIDNSVRASLVKTWAANLCNGMNFLTKYISSDGNATEKRIACLAWLEKAVPLLFLGLRDAIAELSSSKAKKRDVDWAGGIDAQDIAINCIKGLIFLVHAAGSVEITPEWTASIENAVTQMSKCILQPSLDPNPKSVPSIRVDLLKMSCELIQSLATSTSTKVAESSALLMAVLTPLNKLQSDSLDFDKESVGIVTSSCLTATSSLISRSKTPSALAKAMIPLALTVLSPEKSAPDNAKTAAGSLLQECLKSDGIRTKELGRIAVDMAKACNWNAWTVVCSANDGAAAGQSMEVAQGFLLDSGNSARQRATLTAVRGLVQNVATPSPLVGRIVFSVGSEVLAVLQAYAMLNVPKEAQVHRTTTCADAMKIVLVGFQQLSSDGSTADPIMTGFLVVVLETFIAVIRYNGLPNHPAPQGGSSDPALGRMCAQAITHVARTTPLPFKTCMAAMLEHDRAVLEFAVRAEMSGYAAPASSQATTKKKLSLKGFKR
jgi:hypothetical protein